MSEFWREQRLSRTKCSIARDQLCKPALSHMKRKKWVTCDKTTAVQENRTVNSSMKALTTMSWKQSQVASLCPLSTLDLPFSSSLGPLLSFFAWFYQWLQSICFNISSASLDRSSHRQQLSGAFNRTYISHTHVATSLAAAHNLHALIRPKYVPFGAYLVSKQQSSPMLHAFPFFNAAYWVLSHRKRHACYQHDTALVTGKLQKQSF